MGLAEGPQSLLDQGRVGQHPAVQGGVIDLQAALQKQLLDVTVAQGIAQIPGDRLQDQRRLEVPALEIILGPALQLLGNRAQDHGPPPVRRHLCRPQAQRGVNAKNFATRPDLRRTMSAIVWRHQNGAKWRAIPAELGPWSRAAQTFIRWAHLGVWERRLLLAQARGVQLGMTFLDGTSIRAHHKAAGAEKRGPTARRAMSVRRGAARVAATAPRRA